MKTKINERTSIPALKGFEFRFIREEMKMTQEDVAQLKGRHKWTAWRIEKKYRLRVPVAWVKLLRDADPEMFWAAYKLLKNDKVD